MTQVLALANAIDQFITGCKADGTWGAIKSSCVLAGWNNLDGALTPLAGAAPTNFNFWGDADPSWASVSLLLRMNGANASTTFTDSSSNALTATTFGNAQISTTLSKFGGSSGLFDGSGDYLSYAYNAALDLNGSVFTAEAWVYPTAYKAGSTRIIAAGGGAVAYNSTNGIHFILQITSGGLLNFQFWTGSTGVGLNTTAVVPLSAWSHVAVSVSGTNMYLAINGVVQQFTATIARPSTNPTFTVGTLDGEAGGSTTAFVGNIDDLRITKGVARYTTNFTPPTQTFPGSTTDYNRETGLVGDGSTKYLNSNRANNAEPQNSRHLAVYASIGMSASAVEVAIGSNLTTTNGVSLLFTAADNKLYACSAANEITTPWGLTNAGSATGLYGTSRASSTSFLLRVSGSGNTITSTSETPDSANVCVFVSQPATPTYHTTARLAFYSIGENLNLALLDTRVTALINAIAAAIP